VIDVQEALLALDGRELLTLEDDEFSFPSEVVRTVAYGTLAKAERARRHAALAEWLGEHAGGADGPHAERAAYHYGTVAELIAELGPVKGIPTDFAAHALRVLETAASRASSAELWRSAARLYDQCVRLLPPDVDDEHRWQIQLGRAQAHAEYRDLATATSDLEDVLEEAPPESRFRARALTHLAEVKQMEGDYPGSFQTIGDALELWRAIGDEHGLATALRARGRTSMFTGEMDRADADCREALAVYRRLGDRRGEAWALQNLATIAFFRGHTQQADEFLQEAGATFDELGDWGGRSFASALLAWVRFMQGRLDESEKLALEQLPESEVRGDRYVAGLLEMLLGNIALWRGQAAVALERARKAVGRFHTLGDPWAIGQATGIELRAQAAAGEVEAAMDRINSDEATGMAGLPLHVLRAHMLVHVGDPEALPVALHLAGAEGITDQSFGTDAPRALGLALLQAGRADEAVAHLNQLDRDGKAGYADAAALALALVAAGQTDEVRELAERVLDNGTYLDRLQLALADAFVKLQCNDPDAADAFDAIVATADATESRLDQAIVHLARSEAWRALERSDADDAEREANTRIEAIGTPLTGWRTVFSVAARTAPV
jgi:tetratricopeptide (TPR) repeat protein